ncbi:MAG: hypothetical protein MJ056_06560 [Akkermansia sp.]|nr:hypothetical protein [Akkermansia sp.]
MKRIIRSWWAVPLLSLAVLLCNACGLCRAGGAVWFACCVLFGLLLVPVWLAAVALLRRKWQIARVWRHVLAGGAAEVLHLVWCVAMVLLYSAVVLSEPVARDSFADGLQVPQGVDFRMPQEAQPAAAAPCIAVSGKAGVYDVQLRLPQDASSDGAFMVRAEEYTTGKAVETDPMVHRVSAEDRAAAKDGVIEIAFPHIRVYSGDEGEFYGSRWQVIFLPDSGESILVSEDLYLMEGLSLPSTGAPQALSLPPYGRTSM